MVKIEIDNAVSRFGHFESKPVTLQPMTESSDVFETTDLVAQCMTNWRGVDHLAAEWTDLLKRTAWSSVFQTYEWNRSWWDAFAGNDELRLILCRRNRQLVAMAPMMLSKAHPRLGWVRNQLCFIGSPNNASDYCDILLDKEVPGALEIVMTKINEYSRDADCLHLTNMPSHAPNYARIVSFLQKNRSQLILERDQLAPTRLLDNAAEDKKLANKASLRRRYNYFDKAGDLGFHRCQSDTEILAYLDVFFEQHVARRELAGSLSQFNDVAQREFYRSLVSSMVAPGWLKFDVVTFNDKPLAIHFGFEYQGSFIWYKPTFDAEFASRSPGEVLIKYLLQDAIDRKLGEFDFTVGDEPFKFRFANTTRVNMRIIGFRSRFHHKVYELRKRLRAMRSKLLSALGRRSALSR